MTASALAPLEKWASLAEIETRRRIHAVVGAYAYEIADNPIMSDRQWDALAQSIQPKVPTYHLLLDEFFVAFFSPMTGLWIHDHPELDRVKQNYLRFGDAMRRFYEAA